MIPLQVNINKNDIIFRTGDEKLVYKTDTNAFLENTGLTIQNIILPLISDKVFYISLIEIGETFSCGTSLTNALLKMEQEIDNGILVIDFDQVSEISYGFLKAYLQFLLETSNKVIAINMIPEVSKGFSTYVKQMILEKEEEE